MELERKPYQGVLNIIRFNWHFYLIVGVMLLSLILVQDVMAEQVQLFALWGCSMALLSIVVSLLISYYVYDLSDLYELNWLPSSADQKMLNINAGFDETSHIIKHRWTNVELVICDFYDPEKHTEISIKRARAAYPPSVNSIRVSTQKLPFEDNTFDTVIAMLSAHEIRNEEERAIFFEELNRILKPEGQIFVTEHLRDLNNFIAYTLGFFHFHSRASWLKTFNQSKLRVIKEIKTTSFITTFILNRNGDSF